jgi:hypothetical protein
MARQSVYKCAENVVPGDETRMGIVAGVVIKDPMVIMQFHGKGEVSMHKFKPVEVYENGS